jgi:hypothetical protein
MIQLFRLALTAAWLTLLWMTIQAAQTVGLDKAGYVFVGDMAHPWRAQFNADFSFFLLLVAAWLIWSARNRALGVCFAVLSIICGGLFTLAYLFIATFRTQGSIKAVLLGRHYSA